MKKIFSLGMMMMSFCQGFSQLSPVLPKILPETPTAAHLIKVGMGEINKSTGAATASIPLHELKIGNFSMPISLNYFSQGSKPDDICSRAGYGWSMVAGGVISRKVMGMPDEKATRLPIPPNYGALTQSNINYFEIGKTGGLMNDSYDTQPDEFFFSFNGHNGKFLINDAGVPEIITHENLQIELTDNGADYTLIKITDASGIQYFFGQYNAYEKTRFTGTGGGIFPRTAFYLNKILLPSGQSVTLTYARHDVESMSGFAQSIDVAVSCNRDYINEQISYSNQYIVTDACRLTDIETSEGSHIYFGYENFPSPDISGDMRFSSLIVRNLNGIDIKKFNFFYDNETTITNDYPIGPNNISTGRNGRFFLKKISQEDLLSPTSDVLDHNIDYYGLFPSGGSVYSQDHFGFNNGIANQNLIPTHPTLVSMHPSTYWADRTPHASAAVNGMLHDIHYPTKGKEEFIYEANTVASMEEITDMQYHNTIYNHVAGNNTANTHYETLEIWKNQTITLNFFAQQNSPSCPIHGGHLASCKIYDNGTMIQNITIDFGDSPFSASIQLYANHEYTFEIFIFPATDACNNVYLQFNYDAAHPGLQPVEREAGGVRVKEIKKTDGFGASISRYFYYGNHTSPNVSSGVVIAHEEYIHNKKKWVCDPNQVDAYGNIIPADCYECDYMSYISNGISESSGSDKSHIFYKYIIESNDSQFANGFTEYTFYDPSADNAAQISIRGNIIPYPSAGLYPNFTGLVQKTKMFDNLGNLKVSEENTYEQVSTTPVIRSICIKKAYTIIIEPHHHPVSNDLITQVKQFDVRETNYTPGWIRLNNTKNILYDNLSNPYETITNYSYSTYGNILPSAVRITDSKNILQKTIKKYPNDFPSNPVLVAMTNANMITPVIEETTVKGINMELEKTIMNYQSNGVSGGGFQPGTIQQKETVGNTMEDRILFSAYDSKGNLLEVSKALEGKNSYLWDYLQSHVIAEVKNTSVGDIAFTSFESDSKGNFIFSGISSNDLTAPTGKKIYDATLNPVSFPATLNLTKSYIVSYWNKSVSPYNLSGTTSISNGRNVNGWYYHEHFITSMPYGNSISGGVIDELRVYPSDALMTTFTYEPLKGQTSVCDINNRITYYEYDGFNRLSIIRNQDKNILKKICYNYAGMPETCSGIEATPLQVGNTIQTASISRNNCGTGYIGSMVTMTVPANTYFGSTISAANILAVNYLNANVQAYANDPNNGGTCTPVNPCATCVEPQQMCINNICCTGVLKVISSTKVKNQEKWRCVRAYCYCGSVWSQPVGFTDEDAPCPISNDCNQ